MFRTPVGEINVVERMMTENALLGGEGNGGVIDPRVGYVRDSFVAMALVLDLLAATGEPLSRLVDELAALCDGQGPISAGIERQQRVGRDGQASRALGPDRGGLPRARPIAATACGSTGTTAGCTSAPATPSRSCA